MCDLRYRLTSPRSVADAVVTCDDIVVHRSGSADQSDVKLLTWPWSTSDWTIRPLVLRALDLQLQRSQIQLTALCAFM